LQLRTRLVTRLRRLQLLYLWLLLLWLLCWPLRRLWLLLDLYLRRLLHLRRLRRWLHL
jgi:hypothetical protein